MPAGRSSWPDPRPCWPHLWHSKALAGKVGQGALFILNLILTIRGHLIPHRQYDQKLPSRRRSDPGSANPYLGPKNGLDRRKSNNCVVYVIVLAGFVRKIYAWYVYEYRIELIFRFGFRSPLVSIDTSGRSKVHFLRYRWLLFGACGGGDGLCARFSRVT